MKRIFLFFIGYVTAVIPAEYIEKITSLLYESKISARLGKRGKNGRNLMLSESAYKELEGLISERETEIHDIRHHGVPHIYSLYGRRYGIIAGTVIMFFLLMLSDKFVWRIEVSGNERISDEAILSELSELGFSVGTRTKNVDFDILHNRFLAKSQDIAWISVNMHGNVAYAEVREFLPSDSGDRKGAANVVAAKDGIITLVSVFDGKRDVLIGQEVKKGQLLISGVMEFEGRDTQYVYASGEVYAETERVISVTVPLTLETKVKTAEKTTRHGIKIFSSEIFFGGKGRIEEPDCDTITVYRDVTVFGGSVLPIKLISEVRSEYETKTESLTAEKAAAIAYADYKRAFIKETEDVTLLSYDVESGLNEERSAYTISCTLRIIENIAETKEFTVNE